VSIARLLDIAILLLLVCVLWSPSGSDSEASGLITYLRYALFGGLGLSIVVMASMQNNGRNSVLVLPAAAALLLMFLIYTCFSAFWSDSLSTSLIKAGLVGIATMAALAAATARPAGAVLRQVIFAAAFFLVLGFVAAVFIPSVGVETGWLLEGKWRGISGQKNGFGAITALLIVAVVILMWGQRKPDGRSSWLLPSALLAFLGFCLLMSGSRGAQMICLIGLFSAVFIRMSLRLQNFALVLAGLVAVPLIPLGLLSFSADATQLSIFGLSFDTSSRTQIWGYGLQNFGGHELFGFGVSGFWTPERMQIFKDNNGWVLDNFHNGYVTILIEGGLTGIAGLLSVVTLTFFQLRKRAYRAGRTEVFAFAIFNMLVALNLVENEFGRSTSFFFIVFLMVVFSLVRRGQAPVPAQIAARPSISVLTRN
jgi:exopolysaccharide production protein ExoQ